MSWAPALAAQENFGPAADRHAWTGLFPADVFSIFSREEVAAISLVLGVLAFTVTVAVMLVRTRRRLYRSERAAAETIADLRARADRAEALLAADQQVLVIWNEDGTVPEIRCEPGSGQNLPAGPADVLAFGKWLVPHSARELESLVDGLRRRGGNFNVMLKTRSGGHVEADGRTSGGRAVLRLRDLAGQARELAEIYERHKQLIREVDSMRTLLRAIPMPAWMRDASGRLAWVNPAYAAAVGAADERSAVAGAADLLDGPARERLCPPRQDGPAIHQRIPSVLAGRRRIIDFFEATGRHGSAGIAVDVTELENGRAELSRREQAHARTLDKVTTAVAVFRPDGRLGLHNSAFRKLWTLEQDFLVTRPTYGEILDRLRSARRLPEQADYRGWRESQTRPPQSPGRSPAEPGASDTELWHLPDGQVLQVTRSADPDGGLACFFEDVTQSLNLESRFVALTRVQRETLDSLAEGIAVFGSDGRLKLHNPAFGAIWHLSEDALAGEPHVEDVISWCRPLHGEDGVWRDFAAAVTGFPDQREAAAARLERPDGSVINFRAVPLPDGATLAVFTDVSASARIERALRDRNDALLAAERIKNEFVHKVSYELRSPLTNIIGFAQLMNEKETGPLNERQGEYIGYILGSSGALLAIINDILDLATIDAGVMELEVGEVEILPTVEAAVDAIRDRLAEEGVRIEVDVAPEIGCFRADEKRIRQVLFNLLSNAIGFSEEGQVVRLSCRREGGRIVFSVVDQGPGIPEDVRRSVFERFESHALGTRHRGVGLGLSIVKSFVELHGGTVELDTRPGRGTTLTCSFPPSPDRRKPVGEEVGVDHEPIRIRQVARQMADSIAGEAKPLAPRSRSEGI